VDGSISELQKYLEEMSELITEFQDDENCNSMKNIELTGQLFRLYNSEIIRVFSHITQDSAHIYQILYHYINCMKAILDAYKVEDLTRLFLQALKAIGFSTYGHIAILLLISAEDSINLKQDLALEGPLLTIAYQTLLTSTNENSSLETLQNAIGLLSALPLNENT